jgi:Fur family ferric uptake transcriptional regulator
MGAGADYSPPSIPGTRATRQGAAVWDLLDNLEEFRSAQELHDELRRRGEGIGLTTVYRRLQSMAASGLVDTLRTENGESVYRRCSQQHHHHLVCRQCGATVEVQGAKVEAWADSPTSATRSRSSVSAPSARRRSDVGLRGQWVGRSPTGNRCAAVDRGRT